MERVVEQALLLGPRKSMVGVITPASTRSAVPDAPFVVILNAGIIHRVGPNRMHVLLARALAAAGFGVLRVDLSGLGDSEARDDALPPLDATLADIREILDMLQATRQVQRVVLVGLCSGADHSIIYAGTDERVVGVALMDPSIPRTLGYYVHHYGHRILGLRAWLNLMLGRHPIWRALRHRLSSKVPGGSPAEEVEARGPSLEDPKVRAFLQNAYGRALGSGVQMLAVLTSDRQRQHNYRRQLLDAFPLLTFGDQLWLEYFKECDHTFASSANRARLIGLVETWMKATNFRSPPKG
ncbi:MAG: alpha/beta fold hydrolase [Hydrogenophaga sp.]|uniref:alpha/beta fold hydrolase n=1 Tax=Hydrogenophaga sp. TaxID=1904254 RepID=UPI0025BC3B00|nr:alpha/beta fold hydrolase [Hydrogenophaga sp.]MBU7574157.1 alpha/beta fold hydrolase [Hydrogenophaga sp.]